MGERLPCKQEVRSSTLLISTNDLTEIYDFVVGQVPIAFQMRSICQQTAKPSKIGKTNHENYKSIQEKPKEESKQSYQRKKRQFTGKTKVKKKRALGGCLGTKRRRRT